MQKTEISYEVAGILNNLIGDYVKGSKNINEFISHPFEFSAFEKIIAEKEKAYKNREILHTELLRQYNDFDCSDAVKQNIDLLKNENAFTITTAHQPNIFTGPLYSIYKAVSTIKLSRSLKKAFPDKDFVPVFWQGSEDHDFPEINHIQLFGNKIEWDFEHKGEAVGRMKTEGFVPLLEQIGEILGDRPYAEELNTLLKSAYDGKRSIADAYKYIMNQLLGAEGLLILNQDAEVLKKAYLHVLKTEINDEIVTKNVLPQIGQLEEKGYKVQASPRELNIFYIDQDNVRNRIVKSESGFSVLNTKSKWNSEVDLFQEMEEYPQRFSPNVFLRPLYQEQILPNLAYVGGQGELSYWMELKKLFDACETPFPILVLRNMLAIVNSSSCKKIKKLELTHKELFLDEATILKRFVKNHSDNPLELDREKAEFEKLYGKIKEKAISVDPSLGASVESIMQGQLKALSNIESKILRAEKKHFDIAQNQISSVKNALFPNGNLQERSENFMHFYSVYGKDFIKALLENLEPFEKSFYLLKDD
ncbi:MAG: bacillithiol biosynthesis cysteine-adding enzyme BshC [Chitinophagales bacterium]